MEETRRPPVIARKPVIVFRTGSLEREEERVVAARHFHVVPLRTQVPGGSLVIPRYSALPMRNEFAGDIENLGSTLANDRLGHSWIANFDWYEDLKLFTPRSWTEREFPTCGHPGPFVLKGRTNSRKHAWSKRMFAKDRAAAVAIAGELAQDPEILEQGIIYREFVPLVTFETDFTGMPVTNEHRFFFWRTTLVAHGYYWSTATDEAKAKAKLDDEGMRLARTAARIAAEHATFFVIDIAEKASGGWMVVEVNSGEMAGLSEINAETFYASLREAVDRDAVIDLCSQCGIPEGDQHWTRAGGDCVCEYCEKLYFDHDMDERHMGLDGALWLHRLCDGRLVKT